MPKNKPEPVNPQILTREPITPPEGKGLVDPFDIHGVLAALEASFESPDAGIQPIEPFSSDYENPRGGVDLESPVILSVIANKEVIEPVTLTIVPGKDEDGNDVDNYVLVDGWTRLTGIIAYFLQNPDDVNAFQLIPARFVEGTPAQLRTLATITNSARVNFDELATAYNLHTTLMQENVAEAEIEDRVAEFYRRVGQVHHSQISRAMGLYRIASNPELHLEVLAGTVDIEVAISAANKSDDPEAATKAAKATMAAALQKQANKQHSGPGKPVKAEDAIKDATKASSSKRSINEAKRELGLSDSRQTALNRKDIRTALLKLHEPARLVYNAFAEHEAMIASLPVGTEIDYTDAKWDDVRDYVCNVTNYQMQGFYTGLAVCAGLIAVSATSNQEWCDVAEDADLSNFQEAFIAMHKSLTKKERKEYGIGDFLYGLEPVDGAKLDMPEDASTEDEEDEEEEVEAPAPAPTSRKSRKPAPKVQEPEEEEEDEEEAPPAPAPKSRKPKAAATEANEPKKAAKKKASAPPVEEDDDDDLIEG